MTVQLLAIFLSERMFESMLADLRAAEKFIFLEFYIIDEGLMWDSVLEILVEKAAQGVEVKLLYDDIGCMATLPGDYTLAAQDGRSRLISLTR